MTKTFTPSKTSLELFTRCPDCGNRKIPCKRCLIKLKKFDLAREESLKRQALREKEIEKIKIVSSIGNLSLQEMTRVTRKDLTKSKVTIVNSNIEVDELMELITSRKLR